MAAASLTPLAADTRRARRSPSHAHGLSPAPPLPHPPLALEPEPAQNTLGLKQKRSWALLKQHGITPIGYSTIDPDDFPLVPSRSPSRSPLSDIDKIDGLSAKEKVEERRRRRREKYKMASTAKQADAKEESHEKKVEANAEEPAIGSTAGDEDLAQRGERTSHTEEVRPSALLDDGSGIPASKKSKQTHQNADSTELKLQAPEPVAEHKQEASNLDVQSVSPYDGPSESPREGSEGDADDPPTPKPQPKEANAHDLSNGVAPTQPSKPSEEISLPPTPQQMDEVDQAVQADERAFDSHPPSPPKRSFTGPFSFFSRKGSSSSGKRLFSPPPSNVKVRRDTVGSQATMTTVTSDVTSSNDNDEPLGNGFAPKSAHRNSLKDRFKLARLQQEIGITLVEEDGKPGEEKTGESGDVSTAMPTAAEGLPPSVVPKRLSGPISSPISELPISEQLAPGTAAGTTKGPAIEDGPVDWDLWQAVVYEGPSAVQRTSPAELNKAIANGIPSAIRGVVWQVLANSKNEGLEEIYHTLVSSGRDIEARPNATKQTRPESLRPESFSSNHVNGSAKDSASVVSYASSIKSDEPMSPIEPATESGIASPLMPQESHSLDEIARGHTAAVNEEKRKMKEAKEAAAALNKLERAIKRDLGSRTSFSKFLMSAGLQDGLFGICKAYALFDEEIGYAQGMNFIAMPLLFNMPEEEAFCLFVQLMNQYHLRDMFNAEMSGLHLHLYQFERLLEEYEPALYCHLHRRGVHPQLYATQWFLTLFAYRFPLQLVLRIYDLILSEGLETAILKFGVVLMQKNAEELLKMKDMAVLTTYLKERIFDVYIDKSPSASSVLESGFFGSATGIDREVYRADALVQDACAINITSDQLRQYTSEWEEKTRIEKARVAEEDSIRAANASLTLRVKTLTERSEKYDEEHVQIASELVRTKVENQALHDDNESLKMQIKELQGIVLAQPGEVEGKLREEMNRIMKRNIEVQNENRALEEQVAETEAALVSAKMKAAEANDELESIKQRWNSISSMMNLKE